MPSHASPTAVSQSDTAQSGTAAAEAYERAHSTPSMALASAATTHTATHNAHAQRNESHSLRHPPSAPAAAGRPSAATGSPRPPTSRVPYHARHITKKQPRKTPVRPRPRPLATALQPSCPPPMLYAWRAGAGMRSGGTRGYDRVLAVRCASERHGVTLSHLEGARAGSTARNLPAQTCP